MPEISTQLREAFASTESRMYRTIVVVDVNDSTAMKEQQREVTWLNSLGWLYDIVTGIATDEVPDVVVKYLGDGIMLVFDTDHTTAAVNVAIRIQETIAKAAANGMIGFTCSVGISTGEVVGFTTPSGNLDFVGRDVDKAFRLCSAANAKAIFVDTATLGAANTTRFESEFGKAVRRSSDQYTGDAQKVPLKGFEQPVAYHEILWDELPHGVKPSSVTNATDRLRAVQGTGPTSTRDGSGDRPAENNRNERQERHHGAVTNWNPDKGYGFIRDPRTGEDFHFTLKLLAYSDDADKLAPHKEVAFVALEAKGDGKRRQAAGVLVVGEPADGPLVALPAGKPHGWVRVEDELGNRHLVYVPIRELVGRKVGDILSFTVNANERGAFAERVELVEDDAEGQAAA